MLVQERRAALEHLLEEQGTIVVSDLAKEWHVSEMTVRRDLKALSEQGIVSRVHGGAVAQGSLRFSERRGRATKAKQDAVNKLLQFVPERGCVYLDGSTTVLGLAQQLERFVGLTIATNNITIFQCVQQFAGLEVCLIGGTLEREVDNFVGPLARRVIEGMAFDAAFLSAYGLDSQVGLCEPSLEDAAIKDLVVSRSSHNYVAINTEKFERRAAGLWGQSAALDLATNLDAQDKEVAAYQSFFKTIY